MKIGELANETGLSTKTIRYYVDIGILPQPSFVRKVSPRAGTQCVSWSHTSKTWNNRSLTFTAPRLNSRR